MTDHGSEEAALREGGGRTLAPDAPDLTEGAPRVGLIGLAALVAVLAVAALLYLINRFVVIPVDLTQAFATYEVPLHMLTPEPLERLSYLVALAVSPPLLLLLLWGFDKACGKREALCSRDEAERWAARLVYILFAALIVANLPATLPDGKGVLFHGEANPAMAAVRVAITSGIAFLLYFAIWKRGDRYGVHVARGFSLLNYLLVVLAGYVSIVSIDSRIIQIDMNHFNVVYNAVIQVVNGKELFYDFPHMYGFYPHFLEPVIRLFGTGLTNFSVVMALIVALFYFLFAKTTVDMCEDKAVAALGAFLFIFTNYFMTRPLAEEYDPYFQGTIRLLGPALSTYLTYRYFNSRSRRLYFAQFILLSFGMFWNLEFGLVMFLTWLLVLGLDELSRRDPRKIAYHLRVGITVFSVVFILFNLYMYLRYGHLPKYGFYLVYQELVYKYGFYTIPMAPFGPWVPVGVIYMVGLAYALHGMLHRDLSMKRIMVFHFAIMGCGIFTYYLGRSHIYNLIGIMYPAVLICVVFSDSLFARMRRWNRVEDKAMAAFCILVAAAVVNTALYDAPSHARYMKKRYDELTLKDNAANPIVRNAEFIRAKTTPGDSVLILSYQSGLYYEMTKTKQDLNLPSVSEWVLKKDYEAFYAYIRSGKKFFMEGNIMYDNMIPQYFGGANFVILDTCKGGSMIEVVCAN